MNERLKLFSEGLGEAKGRGSTSIIIFLIICAVFVAIVLIYNYLKKKYNIQIFKKSNVKKRTFNSLAKSVGLNLEETKMLYDLVVRQNIKFPLTCFTNAKMLDEVLKKGLHGIDNNAKLSEKDKIYDSYLLLETKRKIENSLKKNIGIKSTHLIREKQKIVIFVKGIGYFYSTVIKNSKDYLTINMVSEKISKRLFRVGEFIKCYFWREEDAGYTFETEIVNYGEGIRTYFLRHSDNLIRSQKRKYRRVPVNFTGEIYPVYFRVVNNKKIYSAGTVISKVSIVDLSAGGLKMRADGIDEKVKYVKVVFGVDRFNVNVIGKIIRLYQENEFKKITIQFIKMSLRDRNLINTYVYNYLPGYN